MPVLKNFEDYNNSLEERQIFLAGSSYNSIYTDVGVRNNVLLYVDSKSRVNMKDLKDFLKNSLGTKRGKHVDRTWIHKFARYFVVSKSGRKYEFRLSRHGAKVTNIIKTEIRAKNLKLRY